MKIYTRPRSPYWWITYYELDRRIRESTGLPHNGRKSPTKSDPVNDLVNQLRLRKVSGRYGITIRLNEIKTVDWLTQYRSFKSSEWRERSAKRAESLSTCFIGWEKCPKSLSAIDYSTVADYLQTMTEKSLNYRRSIIQFFKGAWNEAAKRNYCKPEDNPWSQITLKKDHDELGKEALSDADIANLFQSDMPDWLKLSASISLYTGARGDNVIHLRWEHIDTDFNVINFPRSKTKAYSVPLHPNLRALLQPIGTAGPVVQELNDQIDGYLSAQFARWAKKLGFKFRFHALRHTFNSRLIMNGVDKSSAMLLMNHKSGTTNDIYTHADARAMADKIAVLDFSVPKVCPTDSVQCKAG